MNKKYTIPKELTRIISISEYTMDINGRFTIVTDIVDTKIFDKYYKQWFKDTNSTIRCGESLVSYIKDRLPNNIFLLKEDYLRIIKGKSVVSVSDNEYKEQNN